MPFRSRTVSPRAKAPFNWGLILADRSREHRKSIMGKDLILGPFFRMGKDLILGPFFRSTCF